MIISNIFFNSKNLYDLIDNPLLSRLDQFKYWLKNNYDADYLDETHTTRFNNSAKYTFFMLQYRQFFR